MAFSGKLELFLTNPPSLCTQDYIGITNRLFYELSLMCLTSKVPFVMLTSQLTNGSSFHLLLLFSPHKPDTKVSRGEKKKTFNREMDQSLPNREQGGAPQHAVPAGAFRQGKIPNLEGGIISGDKVQFGKVRRHHGLSQSESQISGAEEEWLSTSLEANGSSGRSPILQGMQAESSYQRRLAPNGNRPLSSSPKSPNTRGYLNFQSRRPRGQQQDQGHPVTTVKASGIPHRQYSRGRNRTSSETEQGGKGSRGPTQRKRGLSETESRPRWDKYGTSHTGNGRDMLCVFGLFNYYDDFCICCPSAFLFGLCQFC